MIATCPQGAYLVSRKRPGPKPQPSGRLDVKIEFLAAAAWKDLVEQAAAAMGLGLSGYIRLAVNERMARDRQQPPALPKE